VSISNMSSLRFIRRLTLGDDSAWASFSGCYLFIEIRWRFVDKREIE
jgi:hypothetical protein